MKRNGFAAVAVILIVVIILIVAGGIYYWHSRSQTQQGAIPPSNIASSSVQSSNSNMVGVSEINTNFPMPAWLTLPTSSYSTGKVVQGVYSSGYTYKILPLGNEVPTQLIFTAPQEATITVPTATALQIDSGIRYQLEGTSTGQEMESAQFYIPLNPANSAILFFSTVELTSIPTSTTYNPSFDTINRIYAYDTENSELSEIYEEHDHQNSWFDARSGRMLRVIGTDGSRLVIMSDDVDNSPGPCSEIWSDNSNHMFYLDLANISSGLQVYQVPQYKIDEASSSEQSCIQSMEVGG